MELNLFHFVLHFDSQVDGQLIIFITTKIVEDEEPQREHHIVLQNQSCQKQSLKEDFLQ